MKMKFRMEGKTRVKAKVTGKIAKKKPASSESTESASKLIDAKIKELSDWRGQTLAQIRKVIKQADPDVVEEVKWRGVPVWSHDGIICTGETYKASVKMTFMAGASLKDPARLFNSSLEGNTRRAIDFHEGDQINEKALKALIIEAVRISECALKPLRKFGGADQNDQIEIVRKSGKSCVFGSLVQIETLDERSFVRI